MATTNNTRENENKRKRLTQACELCRRKKVMTKTIDFCVSRRRSNFFL